MSEHDPATRLIEALMPDSQGHRDGGLEGALAVLARHPEAALANPWVAAACGELVAMERFLQADSTVAITPGGPRSWVPLLYLCFSRFLRLDPERAARMERIAELLLRAGADPDAHWIDRTEAFGNRETALYGAAGVANRPDLVRMLIDAGADPNDGETPYHMVEHAGVPSAAAIVPLLEPLSRGAALGHLLDYDDLEGLRTMLELGCDPNGPTPFKNQPIHQAVWRGRAREFYELLVQYGADINARNKDGLSAYAMAARAGQAATVRWLIELGADTRLEHRDAYVAAAALGDEAGARALAAAHAELVTSMRAHDRAALCEAAAAGNVAGIETMLALGWDIDVRGPVWGETPLHRAALDGRQQAVRLLLERGADTAARDRQYHATPAGWAAHSGHHELAEMIARHDPGPKSPCDRADTAL